MQHRENISYLIPRDPSIQCWDDRVKLSGPRTKNLIQLGLDELEQTVGGNIKVYLRLKPSSSSSFNAYTVLNSTTLQTEAPKDSVSYRNVTNGIGKLIHKFTFTSVLDQDVTQSDLFKKCVVKNIKKFLNGENYLLMAYGTTSAGKTFTMQGNVDQPGVIPRALDFVFNNLKSNIIPLCQYQPHQYNELICLSDYQLKKDNSHKNFILGLDLTKCQRYPESSHTTLHTNSSSGFSEIYENVTFKLMQTRLTDSLEVENLDLNPSTYKYSVWISMIEIYNEQVYDLLEFPNEKGIQMKLVLRDDENGNTFVKNLRYVNVSSGHEAFQILQFGRTNLHFAPTALNQSSSRSHCIFTITLAKFLDYESSSCAILSRFSFCDLAGIERAKKTLNTKDRLVESKAINTSLSILVKCLTIIKENQSNKEKKLIPFRESKLTKLFREAVTGKEQFSLIVNVTTEANLFDETLNVLKFSAVAQKIVPQNVFMKPKPTKLLKKSRFSQLVSNSSYNTKTIDWDATTVDGSRLKEEYALEIADLQDVIEKLRQELVKERKRCEDIESEIREELTTKFAEMLKKQRDNNVARLENERERLEEMYEKKERRLIKYFEILGKNKRQRLDEKEAKDYEDQEQKIGELLKENEVLNSKNLFLTEQIQKVMEENKNILSECSELKFILAEKERTLEEMKKTMEAKATGEDAFEIELRRQLDEAKTKIADYKILLDEAATDYKDLEENNKYLRNENAVLEQCLAEQKDAEADHLNEISELQKMLSHKRIVLEKMEDTNEKLSEEIKTLTGCRVNEENSLIASVYKKELESLREQFKITSVKLNESRIELEAVISQKMNLESELQTCKDKLDKSEKRIFDSVQESILEKEAEIKKLTSKVDEIHSELKTISEEKELMEQKCGELTSEINLLQKEIKDLMATIANKNESHEKELLDVKTQLNDQIEENRIKEREAAEATDALKLKIEVAERDIKMLPRLQEEIEHLKEKVSTTEIDLKISKEAYQNLMVDHLKEVSKLKEENSELQKNYLSVMKLINSTTGSKSLTARTIEIDKLTESVKKECKKEKNETNEKSNQFEECEKENLESQEASSCDSDCSTDKVGKKCKNPTPRLLAKQMENLSLQMKSTRKKVDLLDDSVHPSTLKRTNRGRKKNDKTKKEVEAEEENETEPLSVKKKGKCNKKLFTENFDGSTDLNASFIELEIPRLRPRK